MKVLFRFLPTGWEWVSIGNVVKDLKSGLSRMLSSSDIGLPVLRSTNITQNGIDISDIKYWYVEDPQGAVTSNYFLKNRDILVNFINSVAQIGKTALYKGELNRDSIYTTNIMRLRTNNRIIPEYLLALSKTQHYQYYVQAITKPAVNQASFTTKEYRKFRFPLPPLPEQRKIAEILSTWDKAIELVGKQIEAKQRLKKGLVQQLLTGKIRFPGFMDEWKQVKLKSLAKLLVSNVDKKTIRGESSIVLCNYLDVYENEYITSKVDFMPATATDTEIKKFSLREGDVLLTKDSETREDIASTSVIAEIVDSLVCGYHIAILRPDPEKLDSIFLAKHLSYGRTHHHFVAYANGATRFGLTISAIENAKFFVPKIDEQKRIAEVFLGLDKEIDRLERKIEVLRQQKQGLMQKLLTGEVRVNM